MSFDEEVPPFWGGLPLPTFNLAAHTASATALSEKLFNGLISKRGYDAEILPTTIKSAIKQASIPIIMTTDDDLAAILTQASQGLDNSPSNREKGKLCLCVSTRLLGFIGLLSVPISQHSVTLDRDELKKVLTFLKESGRTDQFLLAGEDYIIGPDYLKIVMSPRRYPEDVVHSTEDWRLTTFPPGGGELRRGPTSEAESSAPSPVQGHEESAVLRRSTRSHKIKEQRDTE